MAGDSHKINPEVELPDEHYLMTSPSFGFNAIGAGGSQTVSGGAGALDLGMSFDREVTIDSARLSVTGAIFDDEYTVRLIYATQAQTDAAAISAGAAQRLSNAVDASVYAVGGYVDLTIDTALNRIPAGSRLLLQVVTVGGSLAAGDGLSVRVRARTRLIG